LDIRKGRVVINHPAFFMLFFQTGKLSGEKLS